MQHLEHDEIAGYGCARTWATVLGHAQVADRLQQTLNEEHHADEDFSKVAQQVNREAMAAAPG